MCSIPFCKSGKCWGTSLGSKQTKTVTKVFNFPCKFRKSRPPNIQRGRPKTWLLSVRKHALHSPGSFCGHGIRESRWTNLSAFFFEKPVKFLMSERLLLEPAVQRFLSADMPVFDIQVQVQTTLKKIRFSLRCSTSKWFPRCSKLPSLKWSSDRDFQIRFGLFGSIQVVRKVAVFPVSCKLAPWGMFRVQRSTKSDWKLETLLQQPHGLAVWLAGCCWEALLLRNGGFSWEASMCQNLAPTHRRLRHLHKGNRETVCKVQCERFSGHWVSATCKTCVLPVSVATGIQDLFMSMSAQIASSNNIPFAMRSKGFLKPLKLLRKKPSFTNRASKKPFGSDIYKSVPWNLYSQSWEISPAQQRGLEFPRGTLFAQPKHCVCFYESCKGETPEATQDCVDGIGRLRGRRRTPWKCYASPWRTAFLTLLHKRAPTQTMRLSRKKAAEDGFVEVCRIFSSVCDCLFPKAPMLSWNSKALCNVECMAGGVLKLEKLRSRKNISCQRLG